ncbi:MAG TPA: NADH-quinone oxidoreductase subunit A [Polyangiaceae bacterium]
MNEELTVVVYLLTTVLVVASTLLLALVLGVVSKRRTVLTRTTYECGEEPEGPAWLKFHPRYYVVALVFVLFDVEAVFLFAWALVITELGWFAIIDMFVFVGILLLGWLYALRKGALQWQ